MSGQGAGGHKWQTTTIVLEMTAELDLEDCCLPPHVGPQGPGNLKTEHLFGTGKRGHYERGLFAGRISRISKISKFSRISRKWSGSPLFSTVWRFSKISRISKFSKISRKWTFLKRPLFQKTPFSEPDLFLKRR